jgi:glyoxylase-like metal-dependent hydrolase (beta-lactamase superfamily II)
VRTAGHILPDRRRHRELGGRPGRHATRARPCGALFEPETATLVSGDALWQQRLAIIFPELDDTPGFDDAARVLDRIAQLRPRLVLPGHGEPFADVDAALAASRQRLAAFQGAPLKHRAHAARSLVVFHMLEPPRPRRWWDGARRSS